MTPEVKPVGYKIHRVEFVMPHYASTGYEGKHNHQGTVAHRFLVELSYALERWKRNPSEKTPMTQLASLINYAEAYAIENHTVAKGHSKTHTDLSKVVLYVPLRHAKRVEELVWELRYHIGVVTTGERDGAKGHVFFNTSEVQDYLAE